jgi:tetratricopeptide (TPR) repeat protein
MKQDFLAALVLAGCLTVAPRLHAQTPASGDAAQLGQNKAAGDAQKPAVAVPQAGANPFPDDTTSVPVLPAKETLGQPEGSSSEVDSARIPLPGEDADPVRSPDDPAPAAGNGEEQDSSSSLSGLDKLLPKPEDEQTEKKRKLAVKEPTHQEAATKDIEVGGYYLDRKNWKAALSRFESAMVLDPENPEVYWGLAESERHLGDFAQARDYYLKVVDYDPDSRHGKDARKALKEPEIANAQNPSPRQPAPAPQQ